MSTTGAVTAIGALADPIRRRLYNYVAQQHDAVSREEAAEALDLPLTKAKFHLDRLANEGLLDIEYRRMTGRQGPGAGRPSKLYRRSRAEVSVSLPERRYDLMGEILAGAVVRSQQGESLQPAIEAVAYERGVRAAKSVAAGIRVGEDPGAHLKTTAPSGPAAHDTVRAQSAGAESVLTELGYESEVAPGHVSEREGAAWTDINTVAGEELRLRNCPFDSLAQQHRDLVCGTNQHFVQGVLDGAGCEGLQAHLEPHTGYCCVVVRDSNVSDSRDDGS